MKSFSRILDWRSANLILLLLHNVHPLKEAEFATEIPSPSATLKVPTTTEPEVTLLFEKVKMYVEKHKKGVAHKATIPIQEETQTDTNELTAPSTKRAKAVDSQNDAMRFGSVDDGNLKRFYESWLNLGKGQREPDEIEPGNFWKEDDDDSEQQKANLNSGWKDFLPKFDNSHFPGSFDHAHEGDRSDVDTFNVLLTGNTLLPPGEKANAILLSTQKNSLDNLQKLQETVNSAASSAIDENEQLQETLAQIIEEPGRPPYVSVLNSSISSLKELESTLEKLLGSRVILRVNGAENAVTGFIPVRQKSVIQDLLRKTDGLARSDFNSSEGKVNIVNIFIINILPKGVVKTFDEGIMSLPPSEKGSKDTYEADDSSFLISDSSNIPLDSFTSDYFPSVPQAEERVPVNEVMDENLATLHDILIKLQDTTSPSSSVPDAANELNFQVASPQASFPQKHEVEVVGKGNSLRPKPSTYQLNPYGLNLNENNVLDLLPSFVRATTIAPIIPLNEASLHQNIGQKPSVLGLLPNQLFSISSPRFDSISNSTLGGITRKDFPTKDTTSNAQDNFSSRQSELVMGSSSIDSSGNSHSVGKRNFFSNNNAGHPLLNMGNDERYPTTFQQNSKPSSSVFKDIHPINLLNWVNLLANSKKENAKLNSDEIASKSEVVLKASNGTETELQRKEDSLVGGLDFDQIKRVLTIGALPGGLAFASALSPYWAPLVFGKRKKREAKNTLRESFRYFYPHQENQVFQSSNAKENYPQVESAVYSPKNDLEFNNDSKNIVDKRQLKNARSREHIKMNHQDFSILTSFVNSALATMESKSTLSQDKFTDDFGNELSFPTSASSSNYNSAPSGDKIRFE